ncbi:cellulose biosynthesis protein BcsE [Klebsiella michiganensis]|nr:cellulose biosynthesis protein BcsE [Klebsiella michiganensis]
MGRSTPYARGWSMVAECRPLCRRGKPAQPYAGGQDKQSQVAAIVMGDNPNKIIELEKNCGPEKVALFSMPNRAEGLQEMHRDLVCSLEPGNYLFILLCAENAWQNIKSDDLCNWVEKSYRWTNYHRCSLLVLNSGHDIDKQLSPLLREYRSLSGLASIRYQGDNHLFDIAWWGSEKGISARQQLIVLQDENGWRLAQDERNGGATAQRRKSHS